MLQSFVYVMFLKSENCTNCSALRYTSPLKMQTTYYQLAIKSIQSFIFENYLLVD